MNSLNQYVIALSLTSGTIFILSAFVYLKGINKKINQTFALYSLSTAIWSGCEAYAISTTNQANALLWWRINHIGVIFIPVFFVHFVFSLLGLNERKRRFIKIIYSIAFMTLAFDLTPLLIQEVVPKFSFNYFIEPGILYVPFFLLWLSLVIYGVFVLGRAYLKSSGARRNQLKYLWWGTMIGYIGGAPNFLPTFNIEIPFFAPFGTYGVPIYVLMATYAIVAYRLMDIEVVIKKTLVFASLFAVAFGIFVSITVLTQELIASGRLLGLAISSIIIIFSLRPLEDFLTKITDRFLFQKKYDYKHLIRQFMDELKTMVLNARDIAQSTLDFLNSSIRPASSALLMYNRFTNKYDLIASSGFKDRNFKISDDSSLINELREGAKIINTSRDKLLSEGEKKSFVKLGIMLLIPLIIHKDLLGIVLLGKKKSDEEYDENDIAALSDLSGALSIAVNNAQLFDEKADAEKRAMVGTLATGINHEIGNPLNIINIKLQSFKILAEQKMLDKKSKEEIIKDVTDITKTCLENTQRIAEITKKVSEFAKPNKTLALDKVNVSEAIDESISILKHELVLERVDFKKEILCKTPYVMVDRGQLNQIIFNLVKNAAQAIDKESGKITIKVDTHKSDGIMLRITDSGPGIPKKSLDKVFMPFYTTKEPGKGTGLGLALVNRLVERNNGKITVQSEEGKGTTFTLIFKGACYE